MMSGVQRHSRGDRILAAGPQNVRRARGGGGAVVGSVAPRSAFVESFADVSETEMLPDETAVVRHAVAERRRAFGTVRHCARRAMRQIGAPALPILPDQDGAPRWPAGLVGSMTHCAGYRAAVVARSRDFSALGIDAEPHQAVPEAALDLILRDEERARLPALAEARPDLHWGRVLFCAKEAVYKAWFPLTRTWLDFADVSVTAHPDGAFRARLCDRRLRVAAAELYDFDGRWAVGRGLVFAATAVGPRQAARLPRLADAA